MMSEKILHNAILGHVVEYKTCVFFESLSDIKDTLIYNCTGSYGLPESYKEGLSCYTCMHAIHTVVGYTKTVTYSMILLKSRDNK